METASSTADDLDELVIALVDEYDDAYNAWRADFSAKSRAFRKARADDPDLVFERPAAVEPDFWPKFDAFASSGSARAQLWCIEHYQPEADASKADRSADFTRRVMSLLMDSTASIKALPRAVSRASRGNPLDKATAEAILVVMEQVAGDVGVRAEAAYNRVSMGVSRNADEAQKAKTLDAFRAIAALYPDAAYGQRAGGKVFVVERLQIGMVAPDIVGTDVDGNAMKLSDFAGKVRVIDFWGFW